MTHNYLDYVIDYEFLIIAILGIRPTWTFCFVAGLAFEVWVSKSIWLHMLRRAYICWFNLIFDRHNFLRMLINVWQSLNRWSWQHVLHRSSSLPLSFNLNQHMLVDLIKGCQMHQLPCASSQRSLRRKRLIARARVNPTLYLLKENRLNQT